MSSPDGRRILVARVTGRVGDLVDGFRRAHDPDQARRLPPHATLCYWAPALESLDQLELQVRHAFDQPVSVRLGGVREFNNRERTFYIEVLDPTALDRARDRLYDGSYLRLEMSRLWTWHVTCVRASRGRPDLASLRVAAQAFRVDQAWTVDTISYMLLRADRYTPIREWSVGALAAASV